MNLTLSFTFTLLFCCTVLFGQQVLPDEIKVNFKVRDVSLRTALIELSDINDITIAFQEEILPISSSVSVSYRDTRIGKILNDLITPYDIKYRVVRDGIVLLKSESKSSKVNQTEDLSELEYKVISGIVRDSESNEPLVGANIYTIDLNYGAVTNEYGFYSVSIPIGASSLFFSYLGYSTLQVGEINADIRQELDASLNSSVTLNEVVISDSVTKINVADRIGAINILTLEKLNSMVQFGGESDLQRLIYSYAGVSSGADGLGGMSVRGGNQDQNLILLDGVPVYNNNHALGLFSVFNSDVVKDAKFYKGVFPAHYSGRTSSVLDVRTREGNYNELSGSAALGLFTAKAALEGPLFSRGSFLVSYRQSLTGLYSGIISNQIGDLTLNDFDFNDVNLKVNFPIFGKVKFYISYFFYF